MSSFKLYHLARAPGDEEVEPESNSVPAAPHIAFCAPLTCSGNPVPSDWAAHQLGASLRGGSPPHEVSGWLTVLLSWPNSVLRRALEGKQGYSQDEFFKSTPQWKYCFLLFKLVPGLLLLLLLYMVVSGEIISIWISGKIIFIFCKSKMYKFINQ